MRWERTIEREGNDSCVGVPAGRPSGVGSGWAARGRVVRRRALFCGMREMCADVCCVLCVRTEMEMVAEICACGSGCCLTFMLICRNYALLASRAAGAMRGV